MSELFQETYRYAIEHGAELQLALLQHLQLVAVALGISILLCVPLGIWTARSRTAATLIQLVNGLRVIPSLAVLFLAIPYFGLSFTSAALALTLLALPPVLINTDAAYRTIDQAIREAARGMGMTPNQILWRVQTPLALPVIVAGLALLVNYRLLAVEAHFTVEKRIQRTDRRQVAQVVGEAARVA